MSLSIDILANDYLSALTVQRDQALDAALKFHAEILALKRKVAELTEMLAYSKLADNQEAK